MFDFPCKTPPATLTMEAMGSLSLVSFTALTTASSRSFQCRQGNKFSILTKVLFPVKEIKLLQNDLMGGKNYRKEKGLLREGKSLKTAMNRALSVVFFDSEL